MIPPKVATVFFYVAIAVVSLFIGMYSVDYAEERSPAILVLGICFVWGFLWIRALSSQTEKGGEQGSQFAFLFRLFFIALALRVIVCVGVHYIAGSGTFASDDYFYSALGWKIAQIWRGEYFGDPLSTLSSYGRYETKQSAYAYVIAFFYFFFDKVSLVPKVFNCFIGSMTAVYFGKLAWEVDGRASGKLTGILCAVFPSMVLWSGLALKDAIATFCIVYVVYQAYIVFQRVQPHTLLKLVLGLLLLGQMRDYMFILVGGCVALSFFVRGTKYAARNYLIGMVAILSFFFLFRYFGFGGVYVERASFEQLDYYRRTMTAGNSAIHVDADISSPGKALLFLPIGVAYFLFAPFPWDISGLRQAFALPEVLVWYGLFFFFIRGLICAIKDRFRFLAPAITSMILITLTYSLVEGNLGTAYRHRAQVMGLYLMFTAFGLSRFFLARGQRSKELLPQTAQGLNPRSEFESEGSS